MRTFLAFCLAVLSAHAATQVTAASKSTDLIDAIKRGDTPVVAALIRQKVDVNAAGPDGATPLMWAAYEDQLDAAELLLKAGAKAATVSPLGVSALSEAAKKGNAKLIEKLLAAGAVANSVSSEGEPVLHSAASSGNADAVNALLRGGADPNAREPWKGQTALMWAAAGNHALAAKALIEHGANINAKSTEWLVEPARPNDGNITSIRPRGAMSPLLFAAREGAADVARVLIAAGADLNITEPDGANALILATINGHYDLAILLLDAGADPNVADHFGRAVLYAAVDMNTLEPSNRPEPKVTPRATALDVAKAALVRGANSNRPLERSVPGRSPASQGGDPYLKEGSTAFMRAAKTADLEAMRMLLEHGADARVASKDNVTALMLAAGQGWESAPTPKPQAGPLEAIRLCLDNGIDINQANVKGETALHGAATRGADQIVQLLVASGARLDIRDRQGHTPREAALGGGERYGYRYETTATLLGKYEENTPAGRE